MLLGFFALGITVLILGGSICGVAAMVRIQNLRADLEQLRQEMCRLKLQHSAQPLIRGSVSEERCSTSPSGIPAAPEASAPAPAVVPAVSSPVPPLAAASSVTPAEESPAVAVIAPVSTPLSFEMRLGTRWIIWVGAVIFLGGVALGLKYTYDNNLIGPGGRIAIGVLTGIIALFVGEYYERRKLAIPFQAFTGGGLAIFYLCIFFAFQVYQLTGAGIAMMLAVFVTMLAVSLSVLHNAMPIAMLAVLGGYLSPVFLSTGENAPWTLFTYVALLNLVALGAGYFRRWRALDLFCLAGTALLYMGWYEKFYHYPDQMAPALFFTTLFYLMFMVAPVLYSLVRGIPEGLPSLTLIIGNSLFWLFCYYSVLFSEHPHSLGFVALMQALLVLLLYSLWMRRVKEPTATAQSLLVIALSLLTLVVPLWLRFYTVPVAWAAEGVVLIWLSFRFRNVLTRIGGVAALVLAVCGLLYYLPLHDAPFTPVFNVSFGAWLFVILAMACAAVVVNRHRYEEETILAPIAGGIAFVALAMTCFLLSVETFLYWQLGGGDGWLVNASAWLIALWTAIPLLLLFVAVSWRTAPLAWVTQGAYGVSLLVFLFCMAGMEHDSGWLAFNLFFLPRLIFLMALWRGMIVLDKAIPVEARQGVPVLELAGYAGLAVLSGAEMIRWGQEASVISTDMAVGIVSAIWALQACALIWYGLVTRNHLRRYAGFVLFALATGKTVFVDVFNLDAVYRIVSWLGVGLLLVVAALLYQRYSAWLLAEDGETTPGDETDPSHRL